jgi:N-acetylglucosaminyldiphosphoundecaprenol N-acetyl-beta-D-mannosaminyltransferase
MIEPLTTVNILGIPVYDGDIPSATDIVLNTCSDLGRGNRRISATGAHGLVDSKSDPHLARILRSCFLNLPDGMPSVWIGRLKRAKKIKRCYGPDFFASVLSASASLPIKHFFCGGNQGVAEELKRSVRKKFINENVVGTFCPPFAGVDDYDYQAIADKINETRADIVWIGMSSPKQEKFAERLASFTDVQFVVTVGAAFDFHTDRVKQAPRFIQNIGMEWLFRLVTEPRRLYKRYFRIVPLFIYYSIIDLVFTNSSIRR